MSVRLKATELDVYVDGERIGTVTDCGDCWRALLLIVDRGRRGLPEDYASRGAAVTGLQQAAQAFRQKELARTRRIFGVRKTKA